MNRKQPQVWQILRRVILFSCLIFPLTFSGPSIAQVSINNDGSLPHPSAGLDIKSADRGLLAPRVNLVAANQAAPVNEPAVGLLVYNQSLSGISPNNVIPGYYTWNGSSWKYVCPPPGMGKGDMIYWNGSQWSRVPAGMPGQFLKLVNNGTPAWTGTAFPTVSTGVPGNISYSSAECSGEVTWDGGADVTERGLCWGTTPGPTIDNFRQPSGFGTGSFNISISGLSTGTTYYIRAYAINSLGVAYGNEAGFQTLLMLMGPIVTTSPVLNPGQYSATCGGKVVSDGGSAVTERGICWGTSSNPTVSGNHLASGSGTGNFSVNLTGLSQGTTYHARAYAINAIATNYGADVAFTTTNPPPAYICPGLPSIIYGNKTYETVKIGNQCWLRQNLDIGTMVSSTDEQTNNNVIQKYCISNDINMCNIYGGLYQWAEALQYAGGASNYTAWPTVPAGNIKGICPDGWHIPTSGEWAQLSHYLGGDSVSGGKLKEAGTEHWFDPNYGATDTSHFTALPGGGRDFEGYTGAHQWNGLFHSASETGDMTSWSRILDFGYASFEQIPDGKPGGISVRCVKNESYPSWASINTFEVTNIDSATATCGGKITSNGGGSIITSGICWSTSQLPTLANNNAPNIMGTGTFSVNLSGLTPNTLYYARAYVTNTAGTCYGNQVAFVTGDTPGGQPCPGLPTVTYEGKVYHTVKIGNQCWMSENLNAGSKIAGWLNQLNNGAIEKYCYNNDEALCNTYGGLYQWAEAVQYMNGASDTSVWNPIPTGHVRGICPPGWHIPKDSEWCTMAQALEPGFDCSATWLAGDSVDIQLKEAGTAHWSLPNNGVINNTGFSARGGGFMLYYNYFANLKDIATFWAATTAENHRSAFRSLSNDNTGFNGGNLERFKGASVRCLKD